MDADAGVGADGGDVITLFALMWAAATLFHVWGRSGRVTDLWANWTTLSALQALAAGVAVFVLIRPLSRLALRVLVGLGLLIAWFEAPILGSHWIVACSVDLAVLFSFVAAKRGVRLERVLPTMARGALIVFYSFAAFAKLNHAFFTPEVSCGTFYLDELADSLHLTVHSQSAAAWTILVPLSVVVIELSIPVLLIVRRTRHVGVIVALLFHGLIAIDQIHPFTDFSSVLNPLFVLFLPASFASEVLGRYRRLSRTTRDQLRGAVIIGSIAMLAMEFYGRGELFGRLFADGRGWGWVIYDVVLIALVVRYLRQRPEPIERPLGYRRNGLPRWLLIVPALLLLNGLSPYLELRTAYAFNMYSNLRTADGDSNHLLITRTLPLTDYQSDLVRITATSDAGLQYYVDDHFDVVFLQLRDYLSRHQDAALTYIRKGEQHHVDRASDDPELVRPVPSWQSKLFAFRSLDQNQPGRCQESFLPAL